MRASDLSRRTMIASMAVIAGIVAIALALLSGTPSGGTAGPDRTRSIDPVAPLDPSDQEAGRPEKTEPSDDLGDPFARSYGGKFKHKVTVRVTANGPAGVGITYRDSKTQRRRTFTGSYSTTRTIKSRFPVVQVAMQIYPPSTTGSCTVIIDGAKVSSYTTTKRFGVVICGG